MQINTKWLLSVTGGYHCHEVQVYQAFCLVPSEESDRGLKHVSDFIIGLFFSFFHIQSQHGIILRDIYRRWDWNGVVGIPTATDWSVQASKPGGGDSSLLHTFTYRPWGPPCSCAMCAGVLPALKRPRHGVDHPLPSRVQQYLCNWSTSRCPK